jgi:hypothetical protein
MKFYQVEVTRTLLMMNDCDERNRCDVEEAAAEMRSGV